MSSICSTIESTVRAAEKAADQKNLVQKSNAVVRTNPYQRKIVDRCVLGFCLLLITSVATYDVYWSFKTRAILQETEQNPLGTMLIRIDGGDIALFMTCKMLGTMIVILAVPGLYSVRKCWGMTCGIALAFVQSLVFLYLTLGHVFSPECANHFLP